MARPSSYTPEIAEAICLKIATTDKGLDEICEADGMPGSRTVYTWLVHHAEFQQMYARAREVQGDRLAMQTLSIADDTSRDTTTDAEGEKHANNEWINRSRLRVDTRKWLASKLAPRKYGDRLELAGDPDNPVVTKTWAHVLREKQQARRAKEAKE